jgi:internalin A
MIQNEKDAFFAQYAHNTDNAVLEIIWQAKQTRATRLDLGNCGLTELPDALFELTWLEELNLSNWWYEFENEEIINKVSQNEGKANDLKGFSNDFYKLVNLKKFNHNRPGHFDNSDISILKELKNLTYLNLGCHNMSSKKDFSFLKEMKKLTHLYLNNDHIKDLSFLEQLNSLTHLDLGGNWLTDISFLKNLNKLTHLNLEHNLIKDISPLQNLNLLICLNLGHNDLSHISFLQYLKSLTHLNLTHNGIADFMPLTYLSKLTCLDLHNSGIANISFLQNLQNLTVLKLKRGFPTLTGRDLYKSNHRDCRNKIKDISSLKYLKGLNYLTLKDNPIQYIPKEILHNQENCATDLYAYWQDQKQSQTTLNNQLKIMFLGNGCVGKTTLLHWFLDNAFKDLSLEDGRTHGIIIQPYKFKGSDVLAHFWDFGGQEVYHATHRLFLGRRSLYLLVWATESPDAAHEERHPPQYWLDMIADIGGNERSRVLIVQNLFDGQTERNILTDAERQDYEIRGLDITTYCINAKTGVKIKSLTSAIEEEAEQLLKTNIEELPTSWVNIRKAVADKRLAKAKTLARADFEKICRDCGLTTDPSVILGYLHRAGELFHYDNQFDNQIILDQEWALKAVYAVLKLKDDDIINQNGRFRLSQLVKIWKKSNPNLTEEEAKIFLNFMLANKTMFYTEGSYKDYGDNPEFVVPQLLPIEKPEMYSLWEDVPNKTRYQIEYTFLHRDIIERFIVATAHLSKKKSYWRNGLFIDYQNGKALVEVVLIEGKKRIQIECTGTTQNELLKTIREEFNKIRTLDKAKEYRFKNGNWEQIAGEMSYRAEDLGGFKEKAPIFVFPKENIISSTLKTENSMKQHLLNLLAEGKLKEALDKMREISNTQSKYFSDPLIGFLARYHNTKNDNNNGLLTLQEYRIETNRLRVAIESILDSEFDERKVPATFKIESSIPERSVSIVSNEIKNRNPNEPVKIFISFSKSDNDQRKELRQRLRYFEKTDKTIVVWDDRDLYPGIKWNDEISKQIQTADIIVCLMSKHYFGTDYILENEIPLSIDLVNRGKTLIPIVLSKCNWHRTALGKLNALPEKGIPVEDYEDVEDAWNEIVDKILDVVDRLRGKK